MATPAAWTCTRAAASRRSRTSQSVCFLLQEHLFRPKVHGTPQLSPHSLAPGITEPPEIRPGAGAMQGREVRCFCSRGAVQGVPAGREPGGSRDEKHASPRAVLLCCRAGQYRVSRRGAGLAALVGEALGEAAGSGSPAVAGLMAGAVRDIGALLTAPPSPPERAQLQARRCPGTALVMTPQNGGTPAPSLQGVADMLAMGANGRRMPLTFKTAGIDTCDGACSCCRCRSWRRCATTTPGTSRPCWRRRPRRTRSWPSCPPTAGARS